MSRGQGGGAPLENKNGVALKDPDIRQIAYKHLCDHIAKGKSMDSWYFEHEQLTCTYRTFVKYLKNEVEFEPIKKDIAWTKGFQHWESITEASATGADKKKSNTASLQMVMRNKYGWDKKTDEKEAVSNLSDLRNICEKNEITQHDDN